MSIEKHFPNDTETGLFLSIYPIPAHHMPASRKEPYKGKIPRN
ncbi:hypothetical protein [Oscillibacter sp. GMB15532]